MGIFITEVKKHFHLTQGSALHSMLFMLFINDLETRISSKVAKFAYDTKLFRVVKSRKNWRAPEGSLNWKKGQQSFVNVKLCTLRQKWWRYLTKKPLRKDWTIFWRKSPWVTSHDEYLQTILDVGYLRISDAGWGIRMQVSYVLIETLDGPLCLCQKLW